MQRAGVGEAAVPGAEGGLAGGDEAQRGEQAADGAAEQVFFLFGIPDEGRVVVAVLEEVARDGDVATVAQRRAEDLVAGQRAVFCLQALLA